jgi:hypothetical protein
MLIKVWRFDPQDQNSIWLNLPRFLGIEDEVDGIGRTAVVGTCFEVAPALRARCLAVRGLKAEPQLRRLGISMPLIQTAVTSRLTHPVYFARWELMPVHDPLRHSGTQSVMTKRKVNCEIEAKSTKNDDRKRTPKTAESGSFSCDGSDFAG